MKRKYCLIRNDGDLNPSSFVYVVWVGSSLRESVYLSLVEEFCKDCGWYFKRWSPIVDSALEKRSQLARTDGTRGVTVYQMHQLSIFECYQTILDDSWVKLEQSHVMTPQETFMRFRHDPNFLRRINHKNCITSCPPSERKYLSRRKRGFAVEFVLPMLAIIALIVLDTLVTHVINSITF